MTSDSVLTGNYEPWLVCLSVAVAIVAGFAVLDLASRIHTVRGAAWWAWLAGGAAAMGAGIWAPHYIAMEAFQLPTPIYYDWPTVALALAIAVATSAATLFTMSRPRLTISQTLAGGTAVGLGVVLVHSLSMRAMRVAATFHHLPAMVALSAAEAILVSTLALFTGYTPHNRPHRTRVRKVFAAFLLAAAIAGEHYTAVVAAHFHPASTIQGTTTHAVRITPFAVAAIATLALLSLLLVFLIANLNRLFSLQQEQLLQSRILTQTVFENMTEGLVVMDAKGSIILRNQAANRLLSLDDRTDDYAAVVRQFDAFDLDGQPLAPEDWPTARARRGDFVTDYTILYRDKASGDMGSREVTTLQMPSRTKDGFRVLATFRDTTQRWLTGQARSRLASIVESSDDAIIGKDAAGIITSWNKGAERVFGYTPEEMIGQSIRRLLPPRRELEEEGILARILNGENVDHFQTVRRTKAGKLLHVSLTISPIRDGTGKITGASKIARDVTEQHVLELRLQQSQKLEAVGQLTGGIAHDFNNLLGVILGNLELLERTVGDQPLIMKRIRAAREAASHGADLTRRLLTFASHNEMRAQPTNLGKCAQSVLELASRALGPSIRVNTQFDEPMPAVLVDDSCLENAILNLLVNARDAMPNGGFLSVTTAARTLDCSHPSVLSGELAAGTYARLSISDTGSGMSTETRARALEPFFTTKPRGKGTGLGLAMVYGFVKQSGGAIRIYSEVGFGTNIALYLPFAEDIGSARQEKHSASPTVTRGAKVLVVDDEEGLLEIACAYLTEAGYHPIQATRGQEAIDILHHQPDIALLITDVILGDGINGIGLAQRARQISPSIQCIYCSGFPEDALSNGNILIQDCPLLNKPYQRHEFNTAVQHVMCQT